MQRACSEKFKVLVFFVHSGARNMIGHLCKEHYIVLLSLISVLFGPFLFSNNNGKFYEIYTRMNADNTLAPASRVFGYVWAVLYALLVAAIFIVFLHDDLCGCRDLDLTNDLSSVADDDDDDSSAVVVDGVCLSSRLSATLQAATWILIIVNIVLNLSWNSIVMKASPTRATVAFFQTVLTLVTAVAVAILLIFFAARTDAVVYFSAGVYFVYSAWLVVASFLAYNMSVSFVDYAKYDERIMSWVYKPKDT